MAEIKAVIFDLDGTLYNKSHLHIHIILNQLIRGKLFILKREREIRAMIKGQYFGNEESFYDNFFKHIGKENARNWYFDCYMPQMAKILRKHYCLAPWVKEYILSLRNKGTKIVVFSDYGFVEEKLDAIGFDRQWADYLFDAPYLGGLKPCREAFMNVCKKIGIAPQDCLMIGDREDTDGDGARSVGMQFAKINNATKPEGQNFASNFLI